jgi:hypothetical protein
MRVKPFNSRGVLWPCHDCGCEVSPVRNGKRSTWGVRDAVWKQAGMKPQGKRPLGSGEFLCIGCLEDRLGRPLSFPDHTYFTHMPVNRESWRRWLRAR